MSLVKRRKRSVKSDLLALVYSVDFKLVIVNPDFLIRVFRKEGELDGRVEEVTAGEVQLVDIGFFEGELGFRGAKDEPDE
ncbi:hypothetical protein COP2_043414 [Malus domestica]